MSDNYCSDCKTNTEVVFDHSAGDTVCMDCGLVLEARSIDETSEWRVFADDNNDNDPNRVGKPVNVLMNSSPAMTLNKGSSKDECTLAKLQNRGGDPERAIFAAFRAISELAERLHLVQTITDHANEIYKKLDDHKCTRGRNLEALVAGCIYVACRQEGKSRTVKEICSAVPGLSKKDLGRAKELIMNQLKDDVCAEVKNDDLEVYVRRFCSALGMSNREVKAVAETVEKSKDFDIRRNPTSINAAVILMITQLSATKKPLRDISMATLVAEGTIKNAYKDLCPHAAKIIPERFAKDRDLKILSA